METLAWKKIIGRYWKKNGLEGKWELKTLVRGQQSSLKAVFFLESPAPAEANTMTKQFAE